MVHIQICICDVFSNIIVFWANYFCITNHFLVSVPVDGQKHRKHLLHSRLRTKYKGIQEEQPQAFLKLPEGQNNYKYSSWIL